MLEVGPVVELLVGPSQPFVRALTAANQPVPAALPVAAMIDTGAARTVVSRQVVQSLGLQAVGAARMSTPSTEKAVPVDLYNVSLAFPNGVTVANALAIEAPLGGQHIQCLVGRDILQHGVLVYIGHLNQFTLSF